MVVSNIHDDDDDVKTNFSRSVTMKEFLESVNIWRRYGREFGGTFLWHSFHVGLL